MAKQIACSFCGTKYDPSERYLAHEPERCELQQTRELMDDLIGWADHGSPIDWVKGLDALIARAKDLQQRRIRARGLDKAKPERQVHEPQREAQGRASDAEARRRPAARSGAVQRRYPVLVRRLAGTEPH